MQMVIIKNNPKLITLTIKAENEKKNLSLWKKNHMIIRMCHLINSTLSMHQHRIEEISKKKTTTTKLRLLKSQRKSKADLEEDQS